MRQVKQFLLLEVKLKWTSSEWCKIKVHFKFSIVSAVLNQKVSQHDMFILKEMNYHEKPNIVNAYKNYKIVIPLALDE